MSGRIIILDPTGQAQPASHPLARGVPSLEGLTLGILDNQKPNAGRVLEAVAARLREKFPLAGVVKREKRIQSQAAPPELMQDLIKGCHAVIHGVGD